MKVLALQRPIIPASERLILVSRQITLIRSLQPPQQPLQALLESLQPALPILPQLLDGL